MAAKSSKSRPKSKSRQSAKPYPEFPLTAHPSGRWCKKRRGNQYYFGPVDADGDSEAAWKAAVERYKREWPQILEFGTRPPEEAEDGCPIDALCNKFLNAKRHQVEAGELERSSFSDYHRTCGLLIQYLGCHRRVDDLRPDDFARLRSIFSKRWGIVTLKNEINRCRVVFKFASDQRLIDRPVYYGQSFNRPSAKALRKNRNEAGPRMFEADELRHILDAANPVMRAMTLLGINCGFGNTDVATLPQSAVDFESGWIDFPRPKTEIHRHIPLWPETIDALRKAIAQRPLAKDKADLDRCFLTVQGNRWVRIEPKQSDTTRFVKRDTVTEHFRKILLKLKINGRRGLGFYTLRHVFQTIGGEAKDPEAVAAIMGHVDTSMGAVYRERISDERLRDVVETVRCWLWPVLDADNDRK
jgi:integrase